MRSPVKEPGPWLKSIAVMSCQVLLFSWSLSWIKPSNFSAIRVPKVCS